MPTDLHAAFKAKYLEVRRLAGIEGVHMNRPDARKLAAEWLTNEGRFITWADPTGETAVRRVIRQQALGATIEEEQPA